jgi:hypothetical protein
MSEQRTEAWHQERCGKITSSRLVDVMAYSKRDGKPLKARTDYMMELVTELLTGVPIIASLGNIAAIQHGEQCEPLARTAYEIETGETVTAAPFLVNPTVPYVGGSPDFLVGSSGGGEIKCPFSSVVHLNTLLAREMPPEHLPQVMGNIWSSDREWYDFVSYDPRFPEAQRLYIKRVYRDEKYIKLLAEECEKFWSEAQAILTTLGGAAVARKSPRVCPLITGAQHAKT